MKISDKMVASINAQVKAEFDSAYLYLAMSACLMDMGYAGMAGWMRKQYGEEMEHAMKLVDYLYERGARVIIPEIAKAPEKWESPLAIFKETEAHEQDVTELIYKLCDQASLERDYATLEMLQWFVKEQVEEEDSTGEIVRKLEFLKDHPMALYGLDKELGQRGQH